MITFPKSTLVGKTVPKAAFYKNLEVNARKKQRFVDDVGSVTWVAKIPPSTLNVADGNTVRRVFLLLYAFLFQNFLQKFRSVSHAKRAFAKHLSCAYSFEQFALCGTVALLEFIHNLSHTLDGLRLVLGGKSEYDACSNESSASALHITHACRKGIADILDGFFFHAGEVVVGAEHSLCAIMRTTTLLLSCFFFSCFHIVFLRYFICCSDLGYKDNAFIIDT